MRMHLAFSFAVLVAMLVACGTTVQHASRASGDGMRRGDSFRMEVVDGSNRLPVVPILTGNLLNWAWTPSDARNEQVKLAAEQLARRLASEGVAAAAQPASARLVVKLELKSIRRDPLAGWISDGASATINTLPDASPVCAIGVGGSFITAPLIEVIDKLADALLTQCMPKNQ